MLSDKALTALLVFLETVLETRRSYPRTRTVGVNAISKRRRQQGDGHNLLAELKYLPDLFQRYTRLNLERFEYLVCLLTPLIGRSRKMKTVIPSGHRVAMTLRHLAAGDPFTSLAFAYRCGEGTVRVIVKETMRAMVNVLLPKVVPEPSSARHWLYVAEGFLKKTSFPHCLGAFDGRLMRIKNPKDNTQNYMSYKKFPAIVLMALVASDYSFLSVDVGAEGSLCDNTVLSRSLFWKRLQDGLLAIPEPKALPNCQEMCPYFFIGDRGFRMDNHLLVPFSTKKLSKEEAVFNYRLSKARVFAENAFGVLCARWKVFDKALTGSLEMADMTVLAAVCLHNFIIRTGEESSDEFVGEYLSEGMNQQPCPVERGSSMVHKTCNSATVRNKLMRYLNDEGALPNQEQIALQGYWGSKV